MDDRVVVALLTFVVAAVVVGLILIAASGGNFARLRLACRVFWKAAGDAEFAKKLEPLLDSTPAPTQAGPKRPSGVPVRLLAVLQREGRLVDFLLEDIQSYPDAQIGAAVRDIHRQCRAALQDHVVLAPILAQPEGADVEVPASFDPSAIQLIGNVTGAPPFRGTLRHHGWRVQELRLDAPPTGQDELVLMPAEVEIA